jgi:hypothetical protein
MTAAKKATKAKVKIKDLKPKKAVKGGAAIKIIVASPTKITTVGKGKTFLNPQPLPP